MSGQIDYIAAAKQAGVPKAPDPGNGYEVQLVGQKSQATFDQSWKEAKRLYGESLAKNDSTKMSTGRRRLALLYTCAQQKGFSVS
jgi:hypothetical protein